MNRHQLRTIQWTHIASLLRWLTPQRAVYIGLFVAGLATLGKGLISTSPIVIAAPNTDLANQFIYWRQFGYSELSRGHLALWNPYVFCGTPFLGGWQAGLLYPPNLTYLFLPLSRAISLEILVHTVWIGFGAATWGRHHRFHPAAQFTAGIMTMFGGSYFFHVYAGHLSMLDTMAWIPWIFLAADRLIDQPDNRGTLLLTGALTMALLGGHPQTVYNAACTLFLYVPLRLIGSKNALATVTRFVLAAVFVAAIASAQIDAADAATSESTRTGGLCFGEASMFSLPPENLLTLIAPWFFGNVSTYWGRDYIWEMCLFPGMTGCALAGYAALTVKNSLQRIWCALVVALMLVALGKFTPLFALLYRYMPGFSDFRSDSKFAFDAMLFLNMLAAMGLDKLISKRASTNRLGVVILSLSGFLLSCSAIFQCGVTTPVWTNMLKMVGATGDSYLNPLVYSNAVFDAHTKTIAAESILTSALTLAFSGMVLYWAKRNPRALFVVPVIVLCEMLWFVHGSIVYYNIKTSSPANSGRLIEIAREEGRTLQLVGSPNGGMLAGSSDVWGYDPTTTQRYSEFMAFTQHQNPNTANTYLTFRYQCPLYALLRLTDVFTVDPNGQTVDLHYNSALPQAFFAHSYAVEPSRDSLFTEMGSKTFAPGLEALVEAPIPSLPSSRLAGGIATVSAVNSNTMVVTADNTGPSVLVLTDNYSKYWQVSESSKNDLVSIMPVDYTLIGLLLPKGHHVLALTYAPPYFTQALELSGGSAAFFLILCCLELRRRPETRLELIDGLAKKVA